MQFSRKKSLNNIMVEERLLSVYRASVEESVKNSDCK